MDDTLKKAKKLARFMREQGILSLKTQEIEMALSPQAIFPKTPDTSKDQELESPDPMDTLLWSAPGLDPEQEHA